MNPGGKRSIGGVAPALAPVRVEIGVLSLPAGSHAHGRPFAQALGTAVRAELARLLGSEAAQAQLRALAGTRDATAVIDAGRMTTRAGERAGRMGARIATHVAGGLLGTAVSRGRK